MKMTPSLMMKACAAATGCRRARTPHIAPEDLALYRRPMHSSRSVATRSACRSTSTGVSLNLLPLRPMRVVGCGEAHRLLKHLIRSLQERRRDREAEGLGGLEVDHHIELGRMLDREVGRLGALQDAVHEVGRSLATRRNARSEPHEHTSLSSTRLAREARKFMLHGEISYLPQ